MGNSLGNIICRRYLWEETWKIRSISSGIRRYRNSMDSRSDDVASDLVNKKSDKKYVYQILEVKYNAV